MAVGSENRNRFAYISFMSKFPMCLSTGTLYFGVAGGPHVDKDSHPEEVVSGGEGVTPIGFFKK